MFKACAEGCFSLQKNVLITRFRLSAGHLANLNLLRGISLTALR